MLTASLIVAPVIYLAADSMYAARGWDDPTAGVIHLLGALSGPDRDEAVRIMRLPRDQRRGPEVEWVRGKMETEGSVEHARDCVSELAVAARREADAVFLELPRSEARDLLRQSTDYVLEQHGLP